MAKGIKRTKLKIKKEKSSSNDNSTVLAKGSSNNDDFDFDKITLVKFIDIEIKGIKEQYEHLSRKHDKLLRLSSNSKFEIDPKKSTRYKILRSTLRKLCDRNKRVIKAKVLEKEKIKLRYMHKNFIMSYIETASINLKEFPQWRFLQIPAYLAMDDQKVLGETLMSADLVKETLKNEERKLKFIRILSFEFEETLNLLNFHIRIPGISNCDGSKIQFERKEKSFAFIVDDCGGVNYIFEKKYLVNKINQEKSTYNIASEGDFVQISLLKEEKSIWKAIENLSLIIKENWELEINNVLKKINLSEDNLLQTENIWKVAVIMVHGGTDFLNLPNDLNHVKRYFEFHEDMISYYVAFISVVPQFKALVIILGGAIYAKLLSSKLLNKKKYEVTLTVENKKTSKYVTEITKTMKAAVMKIIDGLNLYHRDKFDEAFEQFCLAIDMFPHYKFFYYRSFCLFSMKRYDEAYSDSIRALRILGPINAFDCMLNCLRLEIVQLQLIKALDLSYSLPFIVEELSENRKEELMFIRKKAFNRLGVLFAICKLISINKFELSLPFLKFLANTNDRIKIELGLTYLMLKKYKEAYNIVSFVTSKNKLDLSWYILGSSSYYMIDIEEALNCFKEIDDVKNKCYKSIIYIVNYVKFLMSEGDKYLLSGCLSKAIFTYLKVIDFEKKNERLHSLIWLWIGYLRFQMENYSGAIESFSSSICVNGGSVAAFRFRDVTSQKLKSNGVTT